MEKKIETRVAQTILQKPIQVTVGTKTYDVAPPSIATLILVSEAISRLPDTLMDEGQLVESSLAIAKDCEPIAEVAAILILGAKTIHKSEASKGGPIRRALRRSRRPETPLQRLTRELLQECSPTEVFRLISRLLSEMQVADFFAITTFLQGVNLLRPTKVVSS